MDTYPVTLTGHGLPATIAGSASVATNVLVVPSPSKIMFLIDVDKDVTVSIQLYANKGGTIPADSATGPDSVSANTYRAIKVNSSFPFQSFKVTVTNTSGSTANISNVLIMTSSPP